MLSNGSRMFFVVIVSLALANLARVKMAIQNLIPWEAPWWVLLLSALMWASHKHLNTLCIICLPAASLAVHIDGLGLYPVISALTKPHFTANFLLDIPRINCFFIFTAIFLVYNFIIFQFPSCHPNEVYPFSNLFPVFEPDPLKKKKKRILKHNSNDVTHQVNAFHSTNGSLRRVIVPPQFGSPARLHLLLCVP